MRAPPEAHLRWSDTVWHDPLTDRYHRDPIWHGPAHGVILIPEHVALADLPWPLIPVGPCDWAMRVRPFVRADVARGWWQLPAWRTRRFMRRLSPALRMRIVASLDLWGLATVPPGVEPAWAHVGRVHRWW